MTKYCPVECSMFHRSNIVGQNVSAMISLEVEIRESSTSKYLMHVSQEIIWQHTATSKLQI